MNWKTSVAAVAVVAITFVVGQGIPTARADTISRASYGETLHGPSNTATIIPSTTRTGSGGAPSCQQLYEVGNNGWSTFNSQVSPTPTFQWGYNVTSSGAALVNGYAGGYVTVWISSGTVFSAITDQTYNLNTGATYSPHTQPWNYQFHGSVSKWQFTGGGSEPVANGDIVNLYFTTSGLFGQFVDGPIGCVVEQSP